MSENKTDLSKYNNDWYKTGGSLLKNSCWYFINAIFIHSAFPFSSIKVFLLRLFGASIGTSVTIKPNVNIKYPWHLTIGNHVWIGEQVWIDNLSRVTIKDHCCISQGAMLLCGNHDYSKTTFDLIVKDITLEDGVWIGAKSVVCPGVTIGNHSVLTVNSVASKNLEPWGIYQGNPALKIKERVIKNDI
jgi:putative colanic acid biosynthesis acetyltransferase WcaF